MTPLPSGRHARMVSDRWMKSLVVKALVAVAIGFLLTPSAHADEPTSLSAVLRNSRAALAHLSYLQYTVKATPIREINHPRNQLTWREEGEKCRYDYFYWRNDGSEGFEASYSFDGERSYFTWYGDGLYSTKHGSRPFDDWIEIVRFITLPFDFAVQAEGIAARDHPNLALLKSDLVWARLAKEATLIGTQMYKNRSCLVVRVNHGMYRISNVVPPVALPTYFVVYFDVKSSMPIAWKQYDEQNHLVDALEVTAEQIVPLPKGGWYVAPKQTRLTNFEYQNPESIGTEVNTWTFDYTEINTVPNPGESFKLNLAKARWISDEDTHQKSLPPR